MEKIICPYRKTDKCNIEYPYIDQIPCISYAKEYSYIHCNSYKKILKNEIEQKHSQYTWIDRDG